LTDHLIDWLARREGPWFAHASYWRPHPPYAAAGTWSLAYDVDRIPAAIPPPEREHPPWGRLASMERPKRDGELRRLRAQYFGMISAVDEQLGRVWDTLQDLGMWNDTFVVVTSDHGDQLGDQGTIGKGGFFEASYHVPAIIRDPRTSQGHGASVDSFTENVDILPTLCEAMGIEVPAQCDGMPLTPFLQGERPPWWRDAAHWEYDWRGEYVPFGPHPWPWDRRLERKHLAVLRSDAAAYVQFGDGSWRCFDLTADPTWRTEQDDREVVLAHAQAMLIWRSQHADRTLTDMLLIDGGLGRVPSRHPVEDECR
jgi:arylsulfatase A-like enzyme